MEIKGKITFSDFQSICRCCLHDCKNIISFSVHKFLISEMFISDLLYKCASILVNKDDELPKQLCQKCFEELTNCHKFIDKCRRSEQTLLAVLDQKEVTVKMETPEIKTEEIEIISIEGDPQQGSTSETCSAEKQFNCNFSQKSFVRKELQDSHERLHTGEKSYTCDVCEKSFHGRSNWRQHLNTHSQRKPYKCRYCEKTFSRKMQRDSHERTHTGEKPYVCDVCSKSFTDRSNWKKHELTHSQEKPYKCSYCQKGFVRRNEQIVHERLHTGEKPYICDVCSRGFHDRSNFRRHLQTHKIGQKRIRQDSSLIE